MLSCQGDNPYRVAAYRRAGDAVAAQTADLRALLEAGGIEALEEIPGVGRRIAGGLAELARTGRWTYLERLRGSAEPHDIFCTIPGVGPILSKRLHETLHVETLEQLEAALHEKDGDAVAGIGPRRLAILRAALVRKTACAMSTILSKKYRFALRQSSKLSPMNYRGANQEQRMQRHLILFRCFCNWHPSEKQFSCYHLDSVRN